MSATTFNASHLTNTGIANTGTAGTTPRPSLAKRIVARLVSGQERRARAIVQVHLAKVSDDELAGLGWSPADIAALRRSVSR